MMSTTAMPGAETDTAALADVDVVAGQSEAEVEHNDVEAGAGVEMITKIETRDEVTETKIITETAVVTETLVITELAVVTGTYIRGEEWERVVKEDL
ncbi:hypothetical protein V493_04507 [Pseudogymnoascus sp. VKM F-4281 (FW-2241)]|nr:hypothetical protein V493_04507 [Pseudogymnoascus sp. VKM F-4281 (FW-2241)]